MLSSKKLRGRREFRVLIGICIADAIFGLAFILSAISRIQLMEENEYPESLSIPRRMCSMKFYVQLIAIAFQLQGVLSLAVALDRLFAVLVPITYFKCERKYNLLLGVGPYLCVAIATLTNMFVTLYDNTPVVPFCLTRYAVNPGFYSYILLLRISCIITSAFIYIAIIAKLVQFASKGKAHFTTLGQYTHNSSLRRSTITVGLTTCNAFFFLLVPDVIDITGIFNLALNYSTVLYSLSMTNVILNAGILFFRHREIRDKFTYLFRGRVNPNHVHATFLAADSRVPAAAVLPRVHK